MPGLRQAKNFAGFEDFFGAENGQIWRQCLAFQRVFGNGKIAKIDYRELAEQHVAIAAQYPLMQGKDWLTHHVLGARGLIERLPESQRPRFGDILSVSKGSGPKYAIETLTDLGTLPAFERADIYRLSTITDSRDRDLALTRGAARLAMPDAPIAKLKTAADGLRQAVPRRPAGTSHSS